MGGLAQVQGGRVVARAARWDNNHHNRLVHNHWFNHKVQEKQLTLTQQLVEILVPQLEGNLDLHSLLDTLRHTYYRVVLPAELLIHSQFISLLHSGLFYLLSCETRIDSSSVSAAITPEGKLFLALDKETYEQLGIQGQPSHFKALRKQRFSNCITTACAEKDRHHHRSCCS